MVPRALKPEQTPPSVSEQEQAAAVDPRVDPQGRPFPRTAAEFKETFPVPPPEVRAAAEDYCRWVSQEGAENRGKELLKGALDRGDRLLEAAGHWLPAIDALRYAWEVSLDKGHSAGILE